MPPDGRWAPIHQSLWTHWKTFELAALLGINETYAGGHLARLWTWAIDNAPDGDVSRLSERAIAHGAGWTQEVSLFVNALTKAGFLDDDRRLHDWMDYAGKMVERRAADAERKQKSRGHAPDVRGTSNGLSGAVRRRQDETRQDETREPETSTHPQSFPPSGKDDAADAAGRTRKRVPRPTVIPDDVRSVLEGLPTDLGAKAFHDQAVAALESIGFLCDREVFVDDRGDGQRGRLDIVAERDGVRIAFELDDRSPRAKSVTKLLGVGDAARVVVLRCPYDGADHGTGRSGLDAVIGAGTSERQQGAHTMSGELPVRPLTPADLKLWAAVRADAATTMNAANAAQFAQLEPVGRTASGALLLRAPPGQRLDRFRGTLARSLVDAGDVAGANVAIVEG